MQLRKPRLDEGRLDDGNVLPVMNIMLLLIPALLLSMEFASLAAIDVSPPHFTVDPTSEVAKPEERKALHVHVASDGFTLSFRDGSAIANPKIGLAQPDAAVDDPARWDLAALGVQMAALRPELVEGSSLEISAEGDLVLGVLIATIDVVQDRDSPLPLVLTDGV